jgi:hypothetical protein
MHDGESEFATRRLSDGCDTSAALSDLTRWIEILAAPHGYVATARLLGGIRGDRLLLQARRSTGARDEYVREILLETLEALGAAEVCSAFDRAARAAFAHGHDPYASQEPGPAVTRADEEFSSESKVLR